MAAVETGQLGACDEVVDAANASASASLPSRGSGEARGDCRTGNRRCLLAVGAKAGSSCQSESAVLLPLMQLVFEGEFDQGIHAAGPEVPAVRAEADQIHSGVVVAPLVLVLPPI